MDEKNNTPIGENSEKARDEFDDVLEIMRKRRTKAEYSIPHPSAAGTPTRSDSAAVPPKKAVPYIPADERPIVNSFGTNAGAVPASAKPNPEVSPAVSPSKSEASAENPEKTVLKGALAHTIVIPVDSQNNDNGVSHLKGTAIKKSPTAQGSQPTINSATPSDASTPVSPITSDTTIDTPKKTDALKSPVSADATVVDMPIATPPNKEIPANTAKLNGATTVHDAVHPDNNKTTLHNVVPSAPIKKTVTTDNSNTVAAIPIVPSKTVSSPENSDIKPIVSEKASDNNQTTPTNTPGATKVNMTPVKIPRQNLTPAPPVTKPSAPIIKEPHSEEAVSLDDFNTTPKGTDKSDSDESIKVTFLGSVWFGIIKIVLYLCFVLAISSTLAATVIFVANDIFAFVKESEISADIPVDANSIEISSILRESGVISDSGDTTLKVKVMKNNSRKLKDTMNTKKVVQPLKDAGITDIKIKNNTEFTITVPNDADISVISTLLDTVDATNVKSDIQISVNIPEGATTKEVGEILKEAGVIKYAGVFKAYAEYRIEKRSYLTGEYTPGEHIVNPMMNYDKLLDVLSEYERDVSGTVRITIPEGLTVNETLELLAEKGVGKPEDYIEALQKFEYDYRFAKELTENDISKHRFNTDISYRLEGYLFPDTYDFYYNENPISVLDKFLANFNKKFEEEYYERAAQLGLTVDEVITLASMIEKEGNNPSDYYYISSVLHNRLKSSEYPFLNSDATIQYALSERAGLYDIDTNLDHPYNTYKNRGLPPGAICNPGIQAIDAALYPESTNYYYFYTKKNGETVFSRTYEQHQQIVNADKSN